MDKSILLLLVLAVVLFVGCTEKPVELQSFSPDGGNFSILLPGTPKYEPQTVSTAAGPIITKMYLVNLGDMEYGVLYADYPEELVKQSNPQVMLDGARDGGVTNSKGKLVSEKSITLNGYPGRDMNISVGQLGVRTRVYIVNNRIYSIIVSGPQEKVNQTIVEDVLDSFKLTGKY